MTIENITAGSVLSKIISLLCNTGSESTNPGFYKPFYSTEVPRIVWDFFRWKMPLEILFRISGPSTKQAKERRNFNNQLTPLLCFTLRTNEGGFKLGEDLKKT